MAEIMRMGSGVRCSNYGRFCQLETRWSLPIRWNSLPFFLLTQGSIKSLAKILDELQLRKLWVVFRNRPALGLIIAELAELAEGLSRSLVLLKYWEPKAGQRE